MNVGSGVLSSLISRYRTLNININSVEYELKKNISNAIAYKKWIQGLLKLKKIDRLVTFSGRFNLSMLLSKVAEKECIDLYYHESTRNNDKYYYSNRKIHSFSEQMELINDFWRFSNLDFQERINYAQKFYENCRYSKVGRSGLNRSFTKNQIKGYLPLKNKNKRIVFYGNSEDEYAIFDLSTDKLFEWHNQEEAIKILSQVLTAYPNIELVIRVHPNDKESWWNNLKGNFQVITADSKVDTYGLLDTADLVITYRTSIGIEASFWRKPSILMAHSEFSGFTKLNLVKNSKELSNLIQYYMYERNQHIEPLWRESVKIGYFRQEFGCNYQYIKKIQGEC